MKPPILQRSIPDDVVLNILGRLPVKSVIRFRCVSKSWDSSITTPYFISTHLNHNNNNNKDSHDNGYVIHMPSNPSFGGLLTTDHIRKFKKLPRTCLGKLENVTLGFAYHSENNDYKVVRISSTPLSTKEIEVYTLSSDSWRRVGVELTTDVAFGYGKFILPGLWSFALVGTYQRGWQK
ncbi:putative F-box protein At5g42430 [Quercus suber]|uniref:putative F-box protein At5g42430 n=1 Tax=Quercus suber TaxID=58331 RepID=UPI000CE19605|nr:putative F-box protein At5g42430 [Quercus suber]